MDFSTMQNETLFNLGYDDPTSVTSTAQLRTRIKSWLNQAQEAFCAEEQWSFMQADPYTLATVASTQNYNLPADFGKMATVYQTATPLKIDYCNEHRFRMSFPDPTATGNPYIWRYFDSQIWFYPIPSAVINITLLYYKIPTQMSADGDTGNIPVRYQQALTHNATAMGKYQDDENSQGDRFMNLYDNVVEKAKIHYQRIEEDIQRLESKDAIDINWQIRVDLPITEAS